MKIGIIGAGINGIASAYRIQEKYPLLDITVYAEKLSPNTVSDGAGGIWFPLKLENTPAEKIQKWSKITYDYILNTIRTSGDAGRMGLSKVHGYLLSKEEDLEPPEIAEMVTDFKKLESIDLLQFPDSIKSGYSMSLLTMEGRKFIPWIMNQFVENGGKIIEEKIISLSSLEDFDVVVNCSGLGAKELFGDQEVYPTSGHFIRVHAPWIKDFVHLHEKEISDLMIVVYPLQDSVLVGSINSKYSYDTSPNKENHDRIINNASQYVPSLRNAQVVEEWVGLRPCRTAVKLEKDIVTIPTTTGEDKKCIIIHNYGHGGNGITLSWGCAGEVVELLTECIETN